MPVASNTNTTTNAANRDYAVPTFEALRASTGFDSASVGYAGTASDGLAMLDSGHALTSSYTDAPDGHVALTAGLNLPRNGRLNLALGFGTGQARAIATASAAASARFNPVQAAYERQWRRYDARLRRPAAWVGREQYYGSVNVVKASEDKTFPGAIAAGLASPWGQSVPAGNATGGHPTYFGSYREVFARDLYEAFTGLLVAGDVGTARAATRFLFDRHQQADGSMPRNSLLNGEVAPDTGGLQLDETSYPILMDWQSGLAGDAGLYENHVIPAADFLVANGPSDGVERWEEQSGYSPSTIAAEITGLTAASRIAARHGDRARARLYQATADQFARKIKAWTVTTSGPYAPSYFIRVSKTGDPNAAITYGLGNGSITADQRSIVDAGFLELVRLGVLDAMRRMTSGGYLEPEQAWEDPALAASPYGTDPATASIGFRPGHPAGSASPLTWAQAQYARLALALSTGHDLETPRIVSARYVARGMPGSLPLSVSSPSDGASVSSSTVTVSGHHGRAGRRRGRAMAPVPGR